MASKCWSASAGSPQSSRGCSNDTVAAVSATGGWSDWSTVDPSTHLIGRYVSEDATAGIRDQALEEAARIADQVAAGRDDMLQGLAALGALIAEGIRSLKECEQSTRSPPATSQREAVDLKS
ncbi:hypothetical protein [Rhizobium jaguaris]|uniref:Uncharacterized protein n=1 Tax=Rhizobium jaguaris TaxID=1312183 RepID=A0A387G3S6_9HYPH|nr:hypothetical protein [Rhizobium jaguaris]AYG62246.1 hypothetical protein CCGE525_25865 [Rhizobium jaguaris]